jgi:hypothetical protein
VSKKKKHMATYRELRAPVQNTGQREKERARESERERERHREAESRRERETDRILRSGTHLQSYKVDDNSVVEVTIELAEEPLHMLAAKGDVTEEKKSFPNKDIQQRHVVSVRKQTIEDKREQRQNVRIPSQATSDREGDIATLLKKRLLRRCTKELVFKKKGTREETAGGEGEKEGQNTIVSSILCASRVSCACVNGCVGFPPLVPTLPLSSIDCMACFTRWLLTMAMRIESSGGRARFRHNAYRDKQQERQTDRDR